MSRSRSFLIDRKSASGSTPPNSRQPSNRSRYWDEPVSMSSLSTTQPASLSTLSWSTLMKPVTDFVPGLSFGELVSVAVPVGGASLTATCPNGHGPLAAANASERRAVTHCTGPPATFAGCTTVTFVPPPVVPPPPPPAVAGPKILITTGPPATVLWHFEQS